MLRNDYSEIAANEVLDALIKASNEQNVGYGLDTHSKNAANKIKERFDCLNSDVHFICGGTQTNMLVISYALKPYEAVICVKTGHINVHETGAVEGSGHKIYFVEGKNGKITPKEIIDAIKFHVDEHQVKPRMVYISNSTEIGSIYKLEELKEIYKTCKENDLYLFIDGARLGSALTSLENDISPEDIAKYSDVFYIGGTKNGAMFGEALVINNKELQKDFRYHIKNKGAMLAKGFIAGIMFETLFTDDLYFKLAKNANDRASELKGILPKYDILVSNSPTNQIFAKMEKEKAKLLMDKFGCELWINDDNYPTIRFVTSFKTTKNDIIEVENYLKTLKKG